MHIPRNPLTEQELNVIAARINRRHRKDVMNMLETGSDLKRVRHGGVAAPGGWMVWFEKNHFPFSLSSAENFIRSHDWYQTLDPALSNCSFYDFVPRSGYFAVEKRHTHSSKNGRP